MNKYIITAAMLLFPFLAIAQGAGGEIRRPVNNVNASPASNRKPVRQHKESLDPILQRLINNMVHVEGGTFMMGATQEQDEGFASEKPIHQVTLSDFQICKYEVTQEEWEIVMGTNPSYFKGAKRPVDSVSWDDCQDFIKKLNRLTGKRFRLPTEAEWEYAARGGSQSQHLRFAGSNYISSVAWFEDNSGNMTHEVGKKMANELGLYDMSGNIWEWCFDEYYSYNNNPQTNPKFFSNDSHTHVYRGGSWNSLILSCRSFYRGKSEDPTKRDNRNGFRLAL